MVGSHARCATCSTFHRINYGSAPSTYQGLYNAFRPRDQHQRQPDVLKPYRVNGILEHEYIARLGPHPDFKEWTHPNPQSGFRPSVPIVPPHSFETSGEFIVRWLGIISCWIFASVLSILKWFGREVRRCMWYNTLGKQITRISLAMTCMLLWYWVLYSVYRSIKAGPVAQSELPWCCER